MRNSGAILLGCGSVLLAATSAMAQPRPPFEDGVESSVTQLPRNAIPRYYAVQVTPDATNLRFSGHVTIDLDVTQPTNSLTLNAKELTFGTATVRGADRIARLPTARVDAAHETATFTPWLVRQHRLQSRPLPVAQPELACHIALPIPRTLESHLRRNVSPLYGSQL